MKNRPELKTVLMGIWATQRNQCMEIYINTINEGKITNVDLQNLMNKPELLRSVSDIVLAWLYEPLLQSFDRLKPLDYYFTKEEIIEAHGTVSGRKKANFPIRFPILAKLRSNSYLSCLSIQEILSLKESGVIKWKDKMQRETVITKVGDSLVSHIKYDDDRAREIGKCMLDGDFYPNAFRWHILPIDCEYNVTNDSIILKSGYIAEIDGQHRDKGSEYALAQNPDIEMNIPIVFTIGNMSMAQAIINQDEKRAPIDENVVESYKQTSGNRIVKSVIASEDLDPVYKFADTKQGLKAGSGFVLISEFGKSVEKYYCQQKLSRLAENSVSDWLVCFLNNLSDILQNEFSNYRELQNQKSPIISDKMFDTYIYISSLVRDDPTRIRPIIKAIDFSLPLKQVASHEYIDQIMKE